MCPGCSHEQANNKVEQTTNAMRALTVFTRSRLLDFKCSRSLNLTVLGFAKMRIFSHFLTKNAVNLTILGLLRSRVLETLKTDL
jgi:hypothetical protein